MCHIFRFVVIRILDHWRVLGDSIEGANPAANSTSIITIMISCVSARCSSEFLSSLLNHGDSIDCDQCSSAFPFLCLGFPSPSDPLDN
ncbi:hypothetical protein BJ165DRAFT_1507064 [Panaeolus papilionaceus]|nr:hypothetical protein BJ165DRAFT_1507064 [Panaeolus papilionaceus]